MGRGNGRELTWGLVFPFTALLISLPTLSRRKPCLCYLIDFPGFACVLGLNKCSLLHFWPTTSSFPLLEVHMESQDHDSGIQLVWTTHGSPTPLCCFVKAQGWIDGVIIKQQSQSQLFLLMFHKLPKKQERTKMACAILKEFVQKRKIWGWWKGLCYIKFQFQCLFLLCSTLKKNLPMTFFPHSFFLQYFCKVLHYIETISDCVLQWNSLWGIYTI